MARRAGVRFKMAGGAALTGASIEAPHATGSDTFLWSRLVSEQFSEPISKSGDIVTMTSQKIAGDSTRLRMPDMIYQRK